MNTPLAGTGYVGLSKAALLPQHNKLITRDIAPVKAGIKQAVNAIMANRRPCVLADVEVKSCIRVLVGGD